MNLVYVYRSSEIKTFKKLFALFSNVLFFFCLAFIFASVWFDLSEYGIVGFWTKTGFIWWSYLALINLRLLIYQKTKIKYTLLTQLAFIITSILWILHYQAIVPLWGAVVALICAIVIALLQTPEKDAVIKP